MLSVNVGCKNKLTSKKQQQCSAATNTLNIELAFNKNTDSDYCIITEALPQWNNRDLLLVSVASAHTIKSFEMLRRWLWITWEMGREAKTEKQVQHIFTGYIWSPTESTLLGRLQHISRECVKNLSLTLSAPTGMLCMPWRAKEGAERVSLLLAFYLSLARQEMVT